MAPFRLAVSAVPQNSSFDRASTICGGWPLRASSSCPLVDSRSGRGLTATVTGDGLTSSVLTGPPAETYPAQPPLRSFAPAQPQYRSSHQARAASLTASPTTMPGLAGSTPAAPSRLAQPAASSGLALNARDQPATSTQTAPGT